MPSKGIRLGLALFLLASLLVYTRLEKEVVLVIDGEPATVRTVRATVGGLLEAQDVEIGPHDRVRPSPEADLSQGMRVEVDHAKEITLVLNGETKTVYVIGQTVDDVLDQINVRAGKNAYVRPSRGAVIEDGDVVEFRRAVGVTLQVGGESTEVITNAMDVGHLLDSLGVILRRHDTVKPSIDAPLTGGEEIRVTRVRFRQVTEQESIAYGTKTKNTDKLMRGQRQVERPGRAGVREVRYRLRMENGEEAGRRQLSQKVIREPVDEIVLVGTRSPNTQTGTASWYERSGMRAAHRTLPFGTRVKVTNLSTGRSITVVIDDRGPFVNGWIIDLSREAFSKLAPTSQGIMRVRLEW